jgi:hypothetical protein
MSRRAHTELWAVSYYTYHYYYLWRLIIDWLSVFDKTHPPIPLFRVITNWSRSAAGLTFGESFGSWVAKTCEPRGDEQWVIVSTDRVYTYTSISGVWLLTTDLLVEACMIKHAIHRQSNTGGERARTWPARWPCSSRPRQQTVTRSHKPVHGYCS